jgi:predicted RNase H-like HicB family nuclease
MKQLVKFPFPIFITAEGKWFVAECPILNIATQGRTENEVKENIKDLIEEYIKDPDTPKDRLKKVVPSSLSYIPVSISKELLYGKT